MQKALFLIPILWIISHPAAFATTYAYVSDATFCGEADYVVIGSYTETEEGLRISVNETLKGDSVTSLPVHEKKEFLDLPIAPNSEGIYFIKRWQDGFVTSCFKPIERLDRIRTLLEMYSAPARFTKNTDGAFDPDFAEILGRLFGAFEISSPEIPTLREHMAILTRAFYEEAPWNQKEKFQVKCRYSPEANPPLSFVGIARERTLGSFVRDKLTLATMIDYMRPTLLPEFTVNVDATNPSEVGGLKFRDALTYLHRCLQAEEPSLITAALTSASKVRDQSAVPLALKLLARKSEGVQRVAVTFLGNSKDVRAVQPLCKLLRSVSLSYPARRDLADALSDALSRLNEPKSLPELEFAVQHRVEWMGQAVGKIGRSQSFEILLESYLRNPKPSDGDVVTGLLWLVMRSNRNVEAWMNNDTYNAAIGIEKKPLWEGWWEKNKEGFEVVRSMRDAVAIQRQKMQR